MSYKVINLTGSAVEIEGVTVLEGVNNFETVSKAFAKAVLDTEKLHIEAKTPVVKTHLLEDPAHAGDGNLTRFSLDDLEDDEPGDTAPGEEGSTPSQTATPSSSPTEPVRQDTDKSDGESPSLEKVHQMNLSEATAYFELLEDQVFLQSVVEHEDTPTAIVKAAKSRLKVLNAG